MERNKSLKKYNTFGVEAVAGEFAEIDSLQTLEKLISSGTFSDKPFLILGEGSNVLFVNKKFDGIVLLNRLKGLEVTEETEETVTVKIAGGEKWSDFVDFTVQKGWWGLENLSLIPGTAGAAPVQNIGAYGREQQECLKHLQAVHLESGEKKIFKREACGFGYRQSVFKTEAGAAWFIVSATYTLQKKAAAVLEYGPLKEHFRDVETLSPKMVSDYVKKIRRSKLPDPGRLGNAGSFFKNPEIPAGDFNDLITEYPEMPYYKLNGNKYKVPTAWLIEQCGWKGKRVGNAGVHNLQALVLVNFGGATGLEIYRLSEAISGSVKAKFGITLEREVRVVF